MNLAELGKLHQKKYRAAHGRYLVEGEHLILELQKAARVNRALQDSELYVTEKYRHWESPFVTHVVSDAQLARLADTEHPQGIVAVVPMLSSPAASASASGPAREKAIYLYQVQDPGNLGTIIRTLGWFGKLRCLLSPGSVDPYNSKAVRASMGAIFHVALETEVELVSVLQRYPRIAALQMSGEPVSAPAFRQFDAFVFGNEARGLAADDIAILKATAFTIPGAAGIESLNLASAVGIAIYELNR